MKRVGLFLILILQCFAFEVRAETVVGIHGFLTSSRSMRKIKKALNFCGCDVYLWDYPSRRKRIEQHGADLVPYLQHIACLSPGMPIHFVAHSTGALVLRSALNTPGCPEEAKIGNVVLLAPPNQGSSLARKFRNFLPVKLAMGDRGGWELMNLCPKNIAYFGEFPNCMQVLVVAGTKGNQLFFDSPNDGFLTVEETRLNTPYDFESFDATHGELLTNSCVLSSMRNFIVD